MSSELLARIARALGPLREELIFTGGLVVDQYSTVPALSGPRPTIDADVVCSATNYTEYMKVGSRLRDLGFTQPAELSPPPFRWIRGELTVDLIPVDASVLGFTNRWYAVGVERTIEVDLKPDRKIPLYDPVVLQATKLESFSSRGSRDPYASHDLDDIVRLIATRPELVAEVADSPEILKAWIRGSLRAALPISNEAQLLAAHLPFRLPPGLVDVLRERVSDLTSNDPQRIP